MKNRTARIRSLLLRWYDENKRDLPWRSASDPYLIWISEIMAQQTRIAALLPYYLRFVAKYPDVHSLAEASEEEVLKVWEGLGYYSRAKNLSAAAKVIAERWNGVLPSSKNELLSLPGVGSYTAGAILSISYGVPEPAVDGNVLRVHARLENSRSDIALPETKKSVEAYVAQLLPGERTGCVTQALMELGALVCIPKNPDCESCPLAELCEAKKESAVSFLPVKSPKKKQRVQEKTILVLRTPDGRVALRKRSERLLSGLFEFWMTEGRLSEEGVEELFADQTDALQNILPLGKSRHVFTHLIWEMEGYLCDLRKEYAPHGFTFFPLEEARGLAIPGALRRYADLILQD